jgi:serine O-acetyltransferase
MDGGRRSAGSCWPGLIGGYAKIGRNALLLHQVTISAPSPGRVEKMPVIGDNVFIGAGAKVIGGIRVGDNVFIGVNAIVAQNIPDNSRVLCTSGVEVSVLKTV